MEKLNQNQQEDIGNKEETTPRVEEVKKQSIFTKHYSQTVGLAILLLITIAGAGLCFYVQNEKEEIAQNVIVENIDSYENWETYVNEEFGFQFSYPNSKFSLLENDNNQFKEFEMSSRGSLELQEKYLSEYTDLIKPNSNPNISWFIDKKTGSDVEQCRSYSTAGELGEVEISGQVFNVREVVVSDDIGGGGLYYKDYSLSMADRCFLLRASIGLQNYEVNSKHLDSRLVKVMNELEDVVQTFKITGPKDTIPKNWKTYIDERFKVSFRYPADWTASVTIDHKNARTVLVKGEDGFIRVSLLIPTPFKEFDYVNYEDYDSIIISNNYPAWQSELYWPPEASMETGIKHQDVAIQIQNIDTPPFNVRITYSNRSINEDEFYDFYNEIVYKVLSTFNFES